MDLATLVAALAFGATPMAVPTVAPNVMRALIWEQSRGKPWGHSRPPITTNCGLSHAKDPGCSAEHVYPATGSTSD